MTENPLITSDYDDDDDDDFDGFDNADSYDVCLSVCMSGCLSGCKCFFTLILTLSDQPTNLQDQPTGKETTIQTAG